MAPKLTTHTPAPAPVIRDPKHDQGHDQAPVTVIEDLAALPAQITASSDRIDQLKHQIEDERSRRDDLIGLAVDQAGLLPVEAARLARISATHINRILAGLSSDL